jgi:hypothetical protein
MTEYSWLILFYYNKILKDNVHNEIITNANPKYFRQFLTL